MRRLVCCAFAALSCLATAEVAVRPGAWDLYDGGSKVASFAAEASCIDAAIERGAGRYTCRTRSSVNISGQTSCSAPDVGGWTRPVPTALDSSVPAADKSQPGTRLHYVSATTGDDKTGEWYYWNGEQVIDALGKTYGADPTNPSGAIKPYKHWSWVASRRDPNHGVGSKGELNGWPAYRYGMPDWYLFKRGETIDLAQDLQALVTAMPGSNVTYGSLALAGGRSPTERQVMTAYGDPCAARPRFIHPQYQFVYRSDREGMPPVKNVLYQSLHFDGHDRVEGKLITGMTFIDQKQASTDIVLEDLWLDGTGGLIINNYNAGQYLIRRSLITDAWIADGTHVQGMYYEGARTGVLRIEESLLLRNGFSHGDPSTMPWPPSGAQIWDLYDRNMYINGELDPKRSGMFDSVSMMGASGDQWRGGGRWHRNFVYQGYVNMGARGGYPDDEGFTGELLSNVLQRFEGTGTNDNRGQPGWGFNVGAGAGFIHVANNIVTGQHPAKWYGALIEPIQQDCYAPPNYPTRKNTITKNIFDTGSAPAGIRVTDGSTNACFTDILMVPGVMQNAVADNIIVNAAGVEHEYIPSGKAPPTTDTAYSGNKVYRTKEEAAAAHGWKDPNRTLRTYLVSQGVDVKSEDGFPEFFDLATKQRRGMWDPRWTARPMVNHVREGFALPLLPKQEGTR